MATGGAGDMSPAGDLRRRREMVERLGPQLDGWLEMGAEPYVSNGSCLWLVQLNPFKLCSRSICISDMVANTFYKKKRFICSVIISKKN